MKEIIISQYKAALKMLENLVIKCPDDVWNDAKHENPFWRIVYHTLFYTSLYLSDSDTAFIPWEKHQDTYNALGALTSDNRPVVIKEIYSKTDVLDYKELIIKQVDNITADAEQPGGFYWLKMSKVELHLYNIRHVQHHAGQLTERLHEHGISGFNWVGRG